MKFLRAGVVLASSLLPLTVYAADLPSRMAPPPSFPVFAAPFDWTGVYAGINAGYAFDGDHTYGLSTGRDGQVSPAGIITGIRTSFFRLRSDGFTGGGQLGYNYQFYQAGPLGNVVLGAEADAAYTGLRGAGSFIAANGEASNYNSNTGFVGTVRARLGYAFDRLLVYGTGGFAYGNASDSVSFLNGRGVSIYSGSNDSLRAGYAFGGGVEYAIPTASFLNALGSGAVTVKAEFIHYDLGPINVALPNAASTDSGYVAKVRATGNLVRAGLNYKFDSIAPSVPVVARY